MITTPTTTTVTMTSRTQEGNNSGEMKGRIIEAESQKRKARDERSAEGTEDLAGYALTIKRISLDGNVEKGIENNMT